MINNLRKLREENGWTVLQLAAKSGVPMEIVARLEEAQDFEGIKPADVMRAAHPFLKKHGLKIDEVYIF